MRKSILITILVALFYLSAQAQIVTTLVPSKSTFNDGLALDNEGNIYASRYFGTTVTKITPDGQTSIFVDGLGSPNGLVFGPDGNLYIPSHTQDRIVMVTPEGDVSTFAEISRPSALMFNPDGSLMVANYVNNTISIIDTNGVISLFSDAPELNGPIGLVRDSEGTLYIGNFTDGKVFKVSDDMTYEEIGDLPGSLGFMTIAGDAIYATAFSRNRIFKIPFDGSGAVVFAGTGIAGGQDGDVNSAKFNQPNGIIATPSGDTLYISEYKPQSLRMITGVLSGTTDVKETAIQNDFNLGQNFPNPFNPSTKISFSIPKAGFINLTVFDSIGREVVQLIDEYFQAGNHAVNFDGEFLSSGIYFYKLNYNGISITKKMLLIK